MKFFIFINENGTRRLGYENLYDAITGSEHHVDDALPNNTIEVLQLVAVASLTHDQ